jgi:hypothetical protein
MLLDKGAGFVLQLGNDGRTALTAEDMEAWKSLPQDLGDSVCERELDWGLGWRV